MTTILLPAGTAQLRYGDLADLIANALHDDPLKAGFAWFNLEKELAQAVMRGALMLRGVISRWRKRLIKSLSYKSIFVTKCKFLPPK